MIPYVVGGGLALAAVPLVSLLGRIAGPRSPEAAALPAAAGAVRSGAAAAAIVVGIGETDADLILLAVLAAVVVGRGSPAVALAVGTMAATAAARVGSSSLADVTGAHSVLGPALLSPSREVWLAAALGLAAGLVALVAVTPAPVALRDLVADPGRVADALAPLVVGLVALIVALGPPLSDDPDAVAWTTVRVALLAGALPAAALIRRLLLSVDDSVLAAIAAVLGGAALLVGVTA